MTPFKFLHTLLSCAAGVGRYGNPRDALRNTLRSMRMPGYVPPSTAGANWTMNPAVRPPHAGGMLNRMPMPARQPVCIDPPMYGQQPAGVFQSVGPQGRPILSVTKCHETAWQAHFLPLM